MANPTPTPSPVPESTQVFTLLEALLASAAVAVGEFISTTHLGGTAGIIAGQIVAGCTAVAAFLKSLVAQHLMVKYRAKA